MDKLIKDLNKILLGFKGYISVAPENGKNKYYLYLYNELNEVSFDFMDILYIIKDYVF